jgi:hypothetical protein
LLKLPLVAAVLSPKFMQPLAEGAFRPSAWLGVRSADPQATPDEQDRGERTLAFARLCLAVSLFVASTLDPQEPAPMSRVDLLLGAYAAFAALALAALRVRRGRWPAMTVMVHVVDLTAAAGIMALKGGSPFWFLSVFALVGGPALGVWRNDRDRGSGRWTVAWSGLVAG